MGSIDEIVFSLSIFLSLRNFKELGKVAEQIEQDLNPRGFGFPA